MQAQKGFTLIELIAVIVILGILAATAVPRFVNLQGEAQAAAAKNIAGSIESAAALNHAIDLAASAGLSTDPFITVGDCKDAGTLLSSGLPDGYSVTALGVDDEQSATCQLIHVASKHEESFVIIGAR